MSAPNRQQGPKIFSDYNIQLPSFRSTVLDNDLGVLELNDGSQEIIRIDYVYRTGRVNESVRASAKAAFYLLREGTRMTTSHEMAEKFDYYGAYIRVFAGLEYSSLSLVVMSRYFKEVWPVFIEMITDPDFTQDELNKYQRIHSEKLRNELSKNDVIAYRRLDGNHIWFKSSLWLQHRTIGYPIIKPGPGKHWYRDRSHGTNNCFVVLSGKYNQAVADLCKKTLGAIEMKSTPFKQNFFEPDKKTCI